MRVRRGYLLTQIAGGVWADKFGGKPILGFGVIWWSVATALTPIAAQMGLPFLLAARACMGIGEGVAMPAMNNLLSRCALPGVSPETARTHPRPARAGHPGPPRPVQVCAGTSQESLAGMDRILRLCLSR